MPLLGDIKSSSSTKKFSNTFFLIKKANTLSFSSFILLWVMRHQEVVWVKRGNENKQPPSTQSSDSKYGMIEMAWKHDQNCIKTKQQKNTKQSNPNDQQFISLWQENYDSLKMFFLLLSRCKIIISSPTEAASNPFFFNWRRRNCVLSSDI